MGAGDWLMASGEARRIHAKTGRPVVVVDRMNRVQWHEVFNGLPYIKQRHSLHSLKVYSASGLRPYIAKKTPDRWTWKPYQPHPAEIAFTAAELEFARPFHGMVMIEPNIKAIGHSNKGWIWSRWEKVVAAMPETRFVQCSGAHQLTAPNVTHAPTATFRQALAVQSVSRAFVGTEGGLHHGAAAVGVPAVILWSEFISPEITGYATHRNLRHAGKPCGSRKDCDTCRASMDAITVDEVGHNLKEILG